MSATKVEPVTQHERYVCTATAPWSPEKGTHAVHPDAISDGGCAEGCCDDFWCPHCGVRWRAEAAQ